MCQEMDSVLHSALVGGSISPHYMGYMSEYGGGSIARINQTIWAIGAIARVSPRTREVRIDGAQWGMRSPHFPVSF